MKSIDYRAYFLAQHPGFFDRAYIQSHDEDEIFDEMALELRAFDPDSVSLPAPEGVWFGWYEGEKAPLIEAVRAVDPSWVQYYQSSGEKPYCAMVNGRIASFCRIERMGEFEGLRFGGPGCVGTVPMFRKKGIGLYMVKNATAILKEQGFDVSYIHYTGVAPWYARLGYRTVLQWNKHGFV
ncbi:MAG: GNAT family N-acetyltransferase [Clostridia bacterium]|nr:GNAT family N-acetyltransferase [Clostridia bacterium]